jgi:hypothetical protein
MADWKDQMYTVFGRPEERRLIHLDENDSVLTNYNTEAEAMEFFRRTYTASRMRGFTFISFLLAGVHSPSFYSQFEAIADVVLDFQSSEGQGALDQLVRVRVARGSGAYDSRGRKLRRLDSGEVLVAEGDAGGVEPSRAKRRLAAIMFTDIVGYSSCPKRTRASLPSGGCGCASAFTSAM